MDGLGRSRRLLSRLEDRVSAIVAGQGPAVLAFSGGVGGLVVGSVARKRTDLRCVVVATADAQDRVAAVLAQKFLDFRVEILPLTARRAIPIARRLCADQPDLRVAEALALVPVRVVLDGHPDVDVLAGFWASRLSPTPRRLLRQWRVQVPLLEMETPRPPSRVDVLEIGRQLGIPDAFLRVRSRSPASGSGLLPAMTALARERRTTVAGLIRR